MDCEVFQSATSLYDRNSIAKAGSTQTIDDTAERARLWACAYYYDINGVHHTLDVGRRLSLSPLNLCNVRFR
jgi:hypothetical protein